MSPWTARALVFLTSAAVLVLEILAGRLLAPYVGVTLETFTGIIGTVLAGISLGAWLGGMAADRLDPRRLLGPVLVAGGVLAMLAPPIVTWFGPGARAAGPTEIVTLTALAFFAPALVLSMVTPMVVKIRLHDLSETGTVVGRYSAIGTAGAIFGTFVTGFLLIATLPSRPIVFGVGGALVVSGVVAWVAGGDRGAATVPLFLAVAAGAALFVVDGPCDTETAYFCARVEVDPNRPSGRVLFLDTLRHSYVDLDDPAHLEFRYARVMDDVFTAVLPAGPVDVLYIGGGGLSLPQYFDATRPGSTNTVLELDPGIVEIASQDLGFTDRPSTTIVTGDARLGIAETPKAAFDLVIGDAFGGPAVPWHLTTREFVEDIRARLRPDGIYALNLIDYPPLGFARAEIATIDAVFSNVLVIAPDTYLSGDQGGNFVVVASDGTLDPAAIEAATSQRGGRETALGGAGVVTFVAGARVLTDDFAPVDQLITRSGG